MKLLQQIALLSCTVLSSSPPRSTSYQEYTSYLYMMPSLLLLLSLVDTFILKQIVKG